MGLRRRFRKLSSPRMRSEEDRHRSELQITAHNCDHQCRRNQHQRLAVAAGRWGRTDVSRLRFGVAPSPRFQNQFSIRWPTGNELSRSFSRDFESMSLEPRRQIRIQSHGPAAGTLCRMESKITPGRFATKRQRARCHFVQHDTEREKIGTRIKILSQDLLRGHVGNRPHGAARAREMLVGNKQ